MLLLVLLVCIVSAPRALGGVIGLPEASELHIHTTGPNCWGTGELKIEYVTTIPGAPSPPEALAITQEEISRHIGSPTFQNMSETEYSCVDGRYPRDIITTAGGDAAEFMLALRILNNEFRLPMNQYVVSTIFRNYMARMARDEPLRQFYMHTDLHAWEHLTQSLNLTEDFDIHSPPDILKDALLRELVLPSNIGCGHIKNMMKTPADYKMSSDVMKYFLRAFFEYMWLEDAARTVANRKLLFVVLTGDHAESAIMSISFQGCVNSLAPAIRSETPESSYFIHHNDASQTLRQNIAKFFSEQFPLHVREATQFVASMNRIYAVQLNETLYRLAKGLPIYSILVTGWELSLEQSVAGAFISSFLAFAFVAALVIMLRNRIVDGADLVARLTGLVRAASNRIIWRWIKIMAPFFVLIGLIFWSFFGWQIMVSIAFSTFTPTCAALAVFWFSPFAVARICAASMQSMQSGAQVAIQSGVLVALVSVAPIFLWLAIVCYLFSLHDQAVLTFGFGLALVNLTVRVGGSIFSKAVQQADEEHRIHALRQSVEALQLGDVSASATTAEPTPLVATQAVTVATTATAVHVGEKENHSNLNAQLLNVIGRSVDDVMGASIDLADSLVSALISSLYVGVAIYGDDGLALPLWIMSVGLFCAMAALLLVVFLVRCCARDSELVAFAVSRFDVDCSVGELTQQKIMRILRCGYVLTSALYLGLSAVAVKALNMDSQMYYCVVIGHLGGYILSAISELATSQESIASIFASALAWLPGGTDAPAAHTSAGDDGARHLASHDLESQRKRADHSVAVTPSSSSSSPSTLSSFGVSIVSGVASVVSKIRHGIRHVSEQTAIGKLLEPLGSGADTLKALVVGMSSSLAPIVVIFAILLSCGNFGGTWGITLAGVSMMATCLVPITFCALSPLLASVSCMFEMSADGGIPIDGVVRSSCEALVWIGNAASNSIKGFATGAASLVSFCLFFTFVRASGVETIDLIADPQVLPGLMLGSVAPNVFAALILNTLSKVKDTITVSDEQSVDVDAVLGLNRAYLAAVADASLTSAMWHLLLPAAFAIGLTECVSFFFGVRVLAGFLAGTCISGLVMANTLTTAGSSMDASSSNSSTNSALGASLKDAGGPSINVLTKLVCLVGIIDTTRSWALFALVVAAAIIIFGVFLVNLLRSGKATFDPAVMQNEIARARDRAACIIGLQRFGAPVASDDAAELTSLHDDVRESVSALQAAKA